MNNKLLKTIAITTILATSATSFAGCKLFGGSDESETSETSVTETTVTPGVTKLVNHMTDEELKKTEEVPFALLDSPWKEYEKSAVSEGEYSYLMTGCWYEIWTKEDYLAAIEAAKDQLDPAYYDEIIKHIQEHPDVYDNYFYGYISGGRIHQYLDIDPKYDGGEGTAIARHTDFSTNKTYTNTLTFKTYDEFKTLLRTEFDKYVSAGEMTQGVSDTYYDDTIAMVDAIIAGTAKQIEPGTIEKYAQKLPTNGAWAWEFDEEKIKEIASSVKEYHFYDAELARTMVVHVVTPPEYDPEKVYGGLVMTDAVWRFQDTYDLLDDMAHNRADARILITVSQDYSVDNWDNEVRADLFIKHRKEFLDFLTDNMMPYLCDIYPINCDYCCLFGHSQAGVFSHYAAFNSDKYENQPFSDYIIASPAFWISYFVEQPDYNDYKNEYGYFDRHTTCDKRIFLFGGSLEDADYAEFYGENDSTLTGLSKLEDRLKEHDVEVLHRHYESNHFMYVSAMLKEWIDLHHVGE